jgi:hypothetical protein
VATTRGVEETSSKSPSGTSQSPEAEDAQNREVTRIPTRRPHIEEGRAQPSEASSDSNLQQLNSSQQDIEAAEILLSISRSRNVSKRR